MRRLSPSLSPDGSSPSPQGSSPSPYKRTRVRVLTKGLESESLKIRTRVRLEYTVGLESYITDKYTCHNICQLCHVSLNVIIIVSNMQWNII